MRKILFRGKRIDTGEWVEGFYFVDHQKMTNSIIDFTYIIGNDRKHHLVNPETVGQYTGLKDKNGKRIFEGDIIECWSQGVKAIGEVSRRSDGMYYIHPAWQKNKTWGLFPNNDLKCDVEIICNVHDNPELLEVEG